MGERRDSLDFIQILFADKPPQDSILIWVVDDRIGEFDENSRKISKWCQTCEEAAEAVDLMSGTEGTHTYIGACTTAAELGPHSRAKTVQITTIYGLWADVDFLKDGSKKLYPPDLASAKKLLAGLPYKPTMLVHTGGGLHAWWLFREPWVLPTDADRDRAQRLVRMWQFHIANTAKPHGWQIDFTHDLARVLRPAGSTNWKYAKPVHILEVNEMRYNPTEIEDELIVLGTVDKTSTQDVEKVLAGNLVLDPNCQAPAMVTTLAALDTDFAATWGKKRKDLTSQSEYDLSIASILATNEATDQQIVDAVIAHRRNHSQDLKLRPDYYARTVAKSRSQSASQQAAERISDTVDKLATGEKPKTEETKAEIVSTLSELFGFTVHKVVKFVSDVPSYMIRTERGDIVLPGIAAVTSYKIFVDCIAAATDVLVPIPKKNFSKTVQAVLSAAVHEDIGADSSASNKVTNWLSQYFESNPPLLDEREGMKMHNPFWRDDEVVFWMEPLRKWIYHSQGEKTEGRTLPTLLKAAGCHSKVVNSKTEKGKPTSTYVWFAPKKILGGLEPHGIQSSRPARSWQDDVAGEAG